MAEYVPRRMRRFLRKGEEPVTNNTQVSEKNPKEDRISEDLAAQIAAQQVTPPASELRYWDQKDPSLDELSNSLFEQLDAQPGSSSPQPVQSSKKDSSDKTQKPPVIQAGSSEPKKESVLEARRRRREEKTIEKPSPVTPSVSAGNAKPVEPPPVQPVSSPVSGLDVADLFAEDPQKKVAREKLEGELKALQQELDADLAAPANDSEVPDMSTLDTDLASKSQKKKKS